MSFRRTLYLALVLSLCWFPLSNAPLASTCSDSEALKTLRNKGEYRSALQEMDTCLANTKQASTDAQALFNDLIKQVLTVDETTSSDDIYRNVQSVLKIHLFQALKFEFADYFEKNPTEHAQLISHMLLPRGEEYRFYYDTGRMFSHSRGIALTDKSLVWKNFTEESNSLAFDDIKSMTLIYEPGLSLTGWKLRVNNDNEIRLSGISDDALILFMKAMIYFINYNKSSDIPEMVMVSLEVPEKEVAILAGWLTLCSDKLMEQGSPIKELQLLDVCFSGYGDGFKLSEPDHALLNRLTTAIFEKHNIPFAEGYNNFKVVLSTHFFKGLKFDFKKNFEVPEFDADYYFYFDKSTLISGSIGLKLTDQSIIWKNLLGHSISWRNLTGLSTRLSFDKISSVTLVHEIGLDAITGWKLRFNEDDKYEFVLSGLCQDNVELFASAIVYFINIASGSDLTLQVPEETREVLTKSFLERHPKIKEITDSVLDALPKSSK